jgi:hypothetical protein
MGLAVSMARFLEVVAATESLLLEMRRDFAEPQEGVDLIVTAQ